MIRRISGPGEAPGNGPPLGCLQAIGRRRFDFNDCEKAALTSRNRSFHCLLAMICAATLIVSPHGIGEPSILCPDTAIESIGRSNET